jgi:hypothetical protein
MAFGKRFRRLVPPIKNDGKIALLSRKENEVLRFVFAACSALCGSGTTSRGVISRPTAGEYIAGDRSINEGGQ